MPALFVGHGSPMNAIEENEFTAGWRTLAGSIDRSVGRPRAVLCISAHWETHGPALTAAKHPETIHDFGGFPPSLHQVRYPAPGDPDLARRAAELLAPWSARLVGDRGLDHGSWSVLTRMYPDADVPIVQLGMDTTRPAREHYDLARALSPLRDESVLILGSGNLVHNLGRIDFDRDDGEDWAERFAAEAKDRILSGDHADLVEYERLGSDARLAIPTPEHYLPLLYVLAVRDEDDRVTVSNDRVTKASISMACVLVESLSA
jgi:4,5-DOPA dioxygenase extradiol